MEALEGLKKSVIFHLRENKLSLLILTWNRGLKAKRDKTLISKKIGSKIIALIEKSVSLCYAKTLLIKMIQALHSCVLILHCAFPWCSYKSCTVLLRIKPSFLWTTWTSFTSPVRNSHSQQGHIMQNISLQSLPSQIFLVYRRIQILMKSTITILFPSYDIFLLHSVFLLQSCHFSLYCISHNSSQK